MNKACHRKVAKDGTTEPDFLRRPHIMAIRKKWLMDPATASRPNA